MHQDLFTLTITYCLSLKYIAPEGHRFTHKSLDCLLSPSRVLRVSLAISLCCIVVIDDDDDDNDMGFKVAGHLRHIGATVC